MKSLKDNFYLAVILPTIIVATLSFTATYANRENRFAIEGEAVQRATDLARESISTKVDASIAATRSIVALWEASVEVEPDEFAAFAPSIIANLDGITALMWIDPDHVSRYVYPLEGVNLNSIDFDNKLFPNRLEPILDAVQSRKPVTSEPVFLDQGFPGIIIYNPIYEDGIYGGAAVAVMKAEALFIESQTFVNENRYDAAISFGDKLLPLSGKELYTKEGRLVTTPNGETAAIDEPFMLHKESSDLEKLHYEIEIPIADKELKLHVDRKPLPYGGWSPGLILLDLSVTLLAFLFLYSMYVNQKRLRNVLQREKDFVSMVSHQLRSPISQIRWALGILSESKLGKNAKELVGEALLITESSAKLVKDLLDVSRIERSVLKVDIEDVPVTSLFDEIIRPLHENIKERKIELDLDPGSSLIVKVDKNKAAEAVRNVLDNAIKYSPKRSKIKLHARKSGDNAVQIIIADKGSGIPKKLQPHIFQRSQAGTGKEESSGAGIGLFLTKAFTERMGGTVTFDSSKQGTEFRFTFPA